MTPTCCRRRVASRTDVAPHMRYPGSIGSDLSISLNFKYVVLYTSRIVQELVDLESESRILRINDSKVRQSDRRLILQLAPI
ncbi:hypothetical protein L3X38_018744 [Prunus dulcis]|uniref:Uncharacterized protein n=1 Tax=Prunus dulcis TaxID=3755 RepID=A0AAD4ZAD7_PRUDU|nr:hypothetical protein L3X38_018744 [Prunus dulcis]